MYRISKLAILICILVFSSCNSYKSVPYFQNIDSISFNEIQQLYDAKIMPKDILTITVNTTDPNVSAPFNLTVQTIESNNLSMQRTTSQAALQQYLVDNTGHIDFPVLGSLKVGGLTKTEAELMSKEKRGPYSKETPVVTVRMTDFKIAVIGEVNHPGQFTINKEKVNVLEALALAGDMTVYGIRDNVKLIRETATGKHEVYTLNFNDANLIKSPYYQMQQNDILVVTPNKVKAQNSDIGNSTTLWFSATGILVSLASLLVTIFK